MSKSWILAALGGVALIAAIAIPKTRHGAGAVLRTIARWVWPTPKPRIRVDELARLKRQSYGALLRDFAVIAPISAAALVLLNLSIYFRGDASAIVGVVSAVQISTLFLALGQVLLYPVLFAAVVFGIAMAYGPTISKDARQNFLPLAAMGFAVITAVVTAPLAIVIVAGALIFRATQVRSRYAAGMDTRAWIKDDREPSDLFLHRYWLEGRRLLRFDSVGEEVNRSPYAEDRLQNLEVKIAERRQAMARLSREHPHIRAGQVTLVAVLPVVATIFSSPILVGPRTLVEFGGGQSVVGFIVPRDADSVIVIPADDPYVSIVEKKRITSVTACRRARGFFSTSLVGWVGAQRRSDRQPSILQPAECGD